MIGSMFVGFIIGLIAGAITSRGERMGCIGKILLGWFGSLIGQFLFGHYSYCSISARSSYPLGYFLETG